MKNIWIRVYLACICVLALSLCNTGYAAKRTNQARPIFVPFCELITNAERYRGKEVSTRASYRYGFEWQEMFCLSCLDESNTWLEFSDRLDNKSRKMLRKAPKDFGIITGTFTGTLQTVGGPFGHGAYQYQFMVTGISNVETIVKEIRAPELLPLKVSKNLCK